METTQQLFVEIDSLMEKNEAETLSVLIPSSEQFVPSVYGLKAEDGYDINRPVMEPFDFCKEKGLEVIDPLPHFMNNFETLYCENETHLTPKGHRLTGEILFKLLLEMGVVL